MKPSCFHTTTRKYKYIKTLNLNKLAGCLQMSPLVDKQMIPNSRRTSQNQDPLQTLTVDNKPSNNYLGCPAILDFSISSWS